jgi:hypothetical protein
MFEARVDLLPATGLGSTLTAYLGRAGVQPWDRQEGAVLGVASRQEFLC